ncbi:GNAT family N-acetyltransferase [Larkinella terrae]|uniref:GNAT family N-acetyltransferase n=1 Tax=Larkinella terrae TaxID=2025311 RepID=A0A7K0EK72_9BACT|nr:GNAT family N-acetyltransferase [Larkinella terrae]MRS62175.1 GNAT family N-acetyltransferase [Larkinella terrae]
MLDVNFEPFPTLSTDRLILRQFKTADSSDLFVLRSNPEIMRFIPRPLARSVQDASLLIQSFNEGIRANEMITWAIALRNSAEVIGTIGFVRMNKANYRAEVGYLLRADYQGTGFMREALTAVVNYGFRTLKLHSIEAVVDPENRASAKLLERCGFEKEGHFKENKYFNGRFYDSVFYSRWTPIE